MINYLKLIFLVLKPNTLRLEHLFLQNLQLLYPKLPKTRRYKYLTKLFIAPKLFSFTLNFAYLSHNLHKSFVLNTKLLIFFINQTFGFFKNLLFTDSGLIHNNLSKSYAFWILKIYDELFLLKGFKLDLFRDFKPLNYSRCISIVGYSFNKKILNKAVLFLIFNFFKLYSPSRNFLRLSHGYVFLGKEFSLFYFYNFFYFRAFNY